jgi:hypothetical protein
MPPAEIKIGELVVPIAEAMNFADTLAIERATDMDVQEWSEELDARQQTDGRMSSTLTAGLLAWWIQHSRPAWTARRVTDFIRQITPEQMAELGEQLSAVEVGADAPEALAGPEPASDSPASSSSSTTEPGPESGEAIQNGTGVPASPNLHPV